MKPQLAIALSILVTMLAACAPSTPALPPEPTPSPTSPAETPLPASPGSTAGPALFVVVAEESEARFLIGEVLAGSPTIVVGRTRDIRGELRVDLSNPASAELGTIQVDLSTLATDNPFRNRAIHTAILETGRDEYRYGTFTATAINGIPDEVTLGRPYTLTLTGDLTIHGVTRTVTIETPVTAVSESRLAGSASLAFPYSDFAIRIPYLPPQVASVEEQVVLEVDLVFQRQ